MAQKFVLHKDESRLTVLSNLHRQLDLLPATRKWVVQISELRKERTVRSNSFMWAAFYAPLVNLLGFTPADWHEEMCGSYFGWKDLPKPDGRVEKVPKRSTTKNELGERDVLEGESFSNFLEYIHSRAAQHGVLLERQ